MHKRNRRIAMLVLCLLLLTRSLSLVAEMPRPPIPQASLPVYAQNYNNSVFPKFEVYSLRRALERPPGNNKGFNVLAVDEETLIYSGDPREEGYIEFFSHQTQQVIERLEFPGRYIYAGELFQGGLLFLHMPRAEYNGSMIGRQETRFTLSYLSPGGERTDLWEGRVFHHTTLPRLCSVGDRVIFAYDELKAEDFNAPGTDPASETGAFAEEPKTPPVEGNDVRQICRIGRISSDLSLEWLMEETVAYQADQSHLHDALQPVRAVDRRASLLYYEGEDSILFTYDTDTDTLSRLRIPETRIEAIFPLYEDRLLFSVADPNAVNRFSYYLLDAEDQVTALDLPAALELTDVVPTGGADYLWCFRNEDDYPLLFLGSEIESFVSRLLLEDFQNAKPETATKPIRDRYHSFVKPRGTYLLVSDIGNRDVRLMRFLTTTAPGTKDQAYVDLETRIKECFRDYGYLEDDYGIYLARPNGEVLFQHQRDKPFYAASSVKIFTILWCLDSFREGLFTPDTEIPYDASRHYEAGSGLLNAVISNGETRPAKELLHLINTVSDNIAFHMLADYRLKFADLNATLGMAEKYQLAVTEQHNVLTPRDLYKAWEHLYELRDDPYVAEYLKESRYSIYPELFPQPLASHKPGMQNRSIVDAGIYWNEAGRGEPVLYAVMLTTNVSYEGIFQALGDIIMQYVA